MTTQVIFLMLITFVLSSSCSLSRGFRSYKIVPTLTLHSNQSKQTWNIPPDVCTVIAEFMNPDVRHNFKATNRFCHSVVLQLELQEISLYFRDLLGVTEFNPEDIMRRIPVYDDKSNGSISLCTFMDSNNLITARQYLDSRCAHLAVKVREITHLQAHTFHGVIEQTMYFVFEFQSGQLQAIFVGNMSMVEAYQMIESLICGRWVAVQDSNLPVWAARYDVKDCRLCRLRYFNTYSTSWFMCLLLSTGFFLTAFIAFLLYTLLH